MRPWNAIGMEIARQHGIRVWDLAEPEARQVAEDWVRDIELPAYRVA